MLERATFLTWSTHTLSMVEEGVGGDGGGGASIRAVAPGGNTHALLLHPDPFVGCWLLRLVQLWWRRICMMSYGSFQFEC